MVLFQYEAHEAVLEKLVEVLHFERRTSDEIN